VFFVQGNACTPKKSAFLRKNIHALAQGYRNTLGAGARSRTVCDFA
jgi:hypothetical protein